MWRALAVLLFVLGGCGLWASYLVVGQATPPTELCGIVRVPSGLSILGNEDGALVGAEVDALVASASVAKTTTERGGTFRLAISPSLKPTVALVKQGNLTLQAPIAPWMEISPGSTALYRALELVDPQLEGRVDAGLSLRLAKLLDLGMPVYMTALQSQMDTWSRSFAIALSDQSLRLQAIANAPSLNLKVALANQLIEKLLDLNDPQKISIACASLDFNKAIALASSPYLYWNTSDLATLSATLTLGDSSQHGQVTVRVSSLVEPLGEVMTLNETASASGVFQGDIPLVRLYNAQGEREVKSGDGKLSVYAEGNTSQMLVVASYQDEQSYAEYREPSSTLTGIIPFAGADVAAKIEAMTYHTISRADGSYAFYDLPAGEYLVVAEKDGKSITEYKRVP